MGKLPWEPGEPWKMRNHAGFLPTIQKTEPWEPMGLPWEHRDHEGRTSHDTDGLSHGTEKEPWDRKGNNHEGFHDTHGSHDTLHTPDGSGGNRSYEPKSRH